MTGGGVVGRGGGGGGGGGGSASDKEAKAHEHAGPGGVESSQARIELIKM